MKVFIRMMILLACVVPFLAPLPVYPAAPETPGGSYVDAGSYDSVNAAVAAARGKTLFISASYKLSANLLIPPDVAMHIAKGGMLINTSNYKMTVQGPFTAGHYQVFDGFKQGEVVFGDGSVREVYPQWWGANVSSSIQKALNSFNSVLLPKGIYLVDLEIRIPANTTLRGEAGAVLKRPDNTAYPLSSMIVNQKFAVDPPLHGDTGILIDGITIDGNKQGGQKNHANGIYLRSATHVVIKNSTVFNCGKTAAGGIGHGIVLSNVKGGMVQGNVVHDNDGDGIVLYTKNSDISVMSNEVFDNHVVGIEVEGRLNKDSANYRNKAISITGNIVYGNGRAGHGILIDWSDAVSVQGNIVHDNTVYLGAITILGCTNITVSGNSVFNNKVTPSSPYTKAGIAVTPHVYGSEGTSRSVKIADNIIEESQEGISLKAVLNSSITGNIITTSASASVGILIEGSADNITVMDNSIRPGAAGTGISLPGSLEGALIDGNTVAGGAKGIALGTPSGKYKNINIIGNLLNGCTFGISASPGVTMADGFLSNNIFMKTGEKDIAGDRAAPVILSSFFAQYNIHDKDAQYWNSVGARPTTGSWKAGDRVLNMSPVEQGAPPDRHVIIGWLCTATGSPGRWVELKFPAGN